MLHPTDFFDLSHPIAERLFDSCEYIWEALHNISSVLEDLLKSDQVIRGFVHPHATIGNQPILIEEGAIVDPGAYIQGPAYIASGATVRHGAFVRENVIMLPGSILGHSSEAKNCIFLPHSAAPHFNYVGDSILGNYVNLGAGTKLSNLAVNSAKDPVTGQRPTIQIAINETIYDTGLDKLGAILGDYVQTGCNAVLNPGCLVGRNVIIYPNLSLRKGYHPPDEIIKLRQKVSRVVIR